MTIIDNSTYVIFGLTVVAFVSFAYVFWKDSISEGFSSNKILDAYFIIVSSGIVGGKFLFRSIDYNYFRYELLYSPLILEGVLIGGGIATFFVIKRNRWSGWKIGDMMAPALSLFQCIIFYSFLVVAKSIENALVATSFLVLYFFIRYLKYKKKFGSSSRFLQRIRMQKVIYTGVLITVYLTVSSLIAILFLLANINYNVWFWWFQMLFYLITFGLSIVMFSRQIDVQEFIVDGHQTQKGKAMFKRLNLLKLFKKRKADIKDEMEMLEKEDPFAKELINEGTRNIDEFGDEVNEQLQHQTIEQSKNALENEKSEIDSTVKKVKSCKYGICEKCQKPISPARLRAYPTAGLCIECETNRK